MAAGFQHRLCTGFPELLERGRPITLNPQKLLVTGEYDPAQTVLYYEYSLDYKGYHKYKVIHETVRNMRVRFGSDIRESVIEQISFHMYLAPDGSHVFVCTTEAICEELLRRARSTFSSFMFNSRELDLKRMNEEVPQQISGGWFKDLKIADVSVAALYGAEVSHSDDWERFSQVGTITVLMMDYQKDAASYKVSVNKKGAIVLFNKLSEEVQVELLENIRELSR